jgi:predicted CoA-binding protein
MIDASEKPRAAETCPLPDPSRDERVRQLLEQSLVVAVVGMSPRAGRVRRQAGLFLLAKGFQVIPIHPTATAIAGIRTYPDLESIPNDQAVEIVSVFVSAARAGAIADEAANAGARVIWFQPGAENPEAEQRARDLGLQVVSGRCIMADHSRLIG